ncbi:MAG: hypothetical protein H0X24_15305 [Ktedonobacterales bacterium]|nr:hypothetical protein [Ktedonobacterales bacterium]
MPIPPLQASGTLPAGEHHATVAEIITAFPATTIERQELNQALQDIQPALTKLKTLAPDMIVDIDGSYVTSKPTPNDIDLLVLTDSMDEIQVQDFFNQECPIPATYLDVHADPLHRRHLVNVFSYTRNNRPKGVLVLDVSP